MPETRTLLLSLVGSLLRSDHEFTPPDRLLLSIVITFCDRTVMPGEMTARLFDEFGTLSAIVAAPAPRLGQVAGMTSRLNAFLKFLHTFTMSSLRSGIQERVKLSNHVDLKDYLSVKLRHLIVEEVHAVFLDNADNLLSIDLISRGTVNLANVYPVEIVRRAIQVGARYIILAHNHPSRRQEPSHDDIVMTKSVIDACKYLKINVIDHVIIAGDAYVSMRELGIL